MGRGQLRRERFGILGGLFDPIHYGHLAIAEQAREELGLSVVLFVPAGHPVHRYPPDADAMHRMRMVEMAIADNPAFEASWLEVKADRPSYTVDTLEALTAASPQRDFVLIVSSETAALMPTAWRHMDRILELAQIAIVSREGYPDIEPAWLDEHFPGRSDRFLLLHSSRLGHSSTDIRERIGSGKSIRYLVPQVVEAYIEENHLYGA
jgi:nicotinate-nucleotide adenylyltransferase